MEMGHQGRLRHSKFKHHRPLIADDYINLDVLPNGDVLPNKPLNVVDRCQLLIDQSEEMRAELHVEFQRLQEAQDKVKAMIDHLENNIPHITRMNVEKVDE